MGITLNYGEQLFIIVCPPYASRKYDKRFGTYLIVWFTGENQTYMPSVWLTGRKNPYTPSVTAIISIVTMSRKESYVLLYAFSPHIFCS